MSIAIPTSATQATPTSPAQTRSASLAKQWIPSVLVLGIFLWSYWTTLQDFVEIWSANPLYSHGYLVAAFAFFLLWRRRDLCPNLPLSPSAWGFALVLGGLSVRLVASYYYFAWPDRISIFPVLVGLCLGIGGWPALRWAWPSIAFLIFMVPLPGFLETGLTQPLQRLATIISTNILQTLGFFAQADGNVILLSEVELGVVEACSGLRMLSVFVALSVAVVLFLDRPWWQRVLVVATSIPIALACNVVRITATGVLHEIAPHDLAEVFFHDVAGWLMMPLALLLLFIELTLWSRLFVQIPRPDTSDDMWLRP